MQYRRGSQRTLVAQYILLLLKKWQVMAVNCAAAFLLLVISCQAPANSPYYIPHSAAGTVAGAGLGAWFAEASGVATAWGASLGGVLGYLLVQQYHAETLQEYFTDSGVSIVDDNRGTHLLLPSDRIFSSANLQNIDPYYYGTLNQVVTVLKQHPQVSVAVSGHSDTVYNKTLRYEQSMAQAKAVADYLLQRGVAGQQIIAVSGEADTNPVLSNQSIYGRAANRRVEVSLLLQQPQPSVQQPLPKARSGEHFISEIEALVD